MSEQKQADEKAREIIAAALALDSDGRRAVYFALESALGYFPVVILSADDLRERINERLEYLDALGTPVSEEDIREACGDTSEMDWSNHVSEAEDAAASRAIEIATERQPPADLIPTA